MEQEGWKKVHNFVLMTKYLNRRRDHVDDLSKDRERENTEVFLKTRFTCFEVLHFYDCSNCGLLHCDTVWSCTLVASQGLLYGVKLLNNI
jgi:hypothetical protein